MKHAHCGGELKPTKHRGRYKCEVCRKVVDIQVQRPVPMWNSKIRGNS